MLIPNLPPDAGVGPGQKPRRLDITDLERIERFRRAGYGDSMSDSLRRLGGVDTVFSDRFKPLQQGRQLVGRALPIKLHSLVEPRTDEEQVRQEARWEAEGGHPQKRMMRAVAARSPCLLPERSLSDSAAGR